MKISLKLKNLINKNIKNGYIKVSKHPDFNYCIYNYTHKCQYEDHWNQATIMCRGLILDASGEIIARPFKKFFNLDEHKRDVISNNKDIETPIGDPIYEYEKYDGSLGILYQTPDKEYAIATRGSFVSPQAIKGTEILHKQLRETPECLNHILLNHNIFTYLFEIIYPENRIVVNYNDRECLVCLGGVDKEYERVYVSEILNKHRIFHNCKYITYPEIISLEGRVYNTNGPTNREGVVQYYKNGTMAKVKFEEYKESHKLVFKISNKSIWKYLVENNSTYDEEPDLLISKLPEQYHNWVKKIVIGLFTEGTRINTEASFVADEARRLGTRKEQAKYIKKHSKHPGLCFLKLDGKCSKELLYRLIEPKEIIYFNEETKWTHP